MKVVIILPFLYCSEWSKLSGCSEWDIFDGCSEWDKLGEPEFQIGEVR